ncbi:MAG TPA: nuclear transport factor 2 family protein, partial [Sphingomonadaceae bacterium]|nr:nuclear transport factor 2 family protein [Sphingomonadaceae bacterium]
MTPGPGVLPWDPAAPPFDPRDVSGRETLDNRTVAERFIQLFYVEDNPTDAFLCWMHPDYIQHNPNAPTGRDATLEVLAAAVRNNPELTHEVKRVIWGPDDLVAVHHHFRRTKDERGWAVVDILRIADGYIVEHWDVMQQVPDPAECR